MALPKFELRQKDKDSTFIGSNCTLWMNGKQLGGVTNVKVDLSANDTTKVVVTFLTKSVKITDKDGNILKEDKS